MRIGFKRGSGQGGEHVETTEEKEIVTRDSFLPARQSPTNISVAGEQSVDGGGVERKRKT